MALLRNLVFNLFIKILKWTMPIQSTKSIAFKWRHIQVELILQCVRWYCKHGISFKEVKEMMDDWILN
ncbi:hypothetical protein CAB17_20455 [Legionella sainthelensi]|nr:hypothetical protein CAB17_20455 [Legionella sainthelensi]